MLNVDRKIRGAMKIGGALHDPLRSDDCPTVCVAGETYSDNLGDGTIADSVSYLIREVCPDVRIRLLDISGRSRTRIQPGIDMLMEHAPEYSWLRLLRQKMAGRLPPKLKWVIRHRRCLREHYKRNLIECSMLIVGGGQLLKDKELGFPLRIEELTRQAEKLGIPVHFLACGVGRNWSREGRRLFRLALGRASTVSVRDQISCKRLNSFDPPVGSRSVCVLDPAIAASSVYGFATRKRKNGKCIGLGIMEYGAVRDALNGRFAVSSKEYKTFWLDLVSALTSSGWVCELFSSGSVADQKLAERLIVELNAKGDHGALLATRPQHPRDLLEILERQDVVVAARLHCCILSLSLCKPVIGLRWDDKVGAFFREIGRRNHCFPIEQFSVRQIIEMALVIRCVEISPQELSTWKDRALEGVRFIFHHQHARGRG